jgi:glutathione S-transferase
MKLYVTPTSPYARLAMIVRLDLGLEDEIELVWTTTRVPDDPVLTFNPSGRVPFLQLDDGSGFEDTDVIVDYLDGLAAPLRYARPDPVDVHDVDGDGNGNGNGVYWRFRRL